MKLYGIKWNDREVDAFLFKLKEDAVNYAQIEMLCATSSLRYEILEFEIV